MKKKNINKSSIIILLMGIVSIGVVVYFGFVDNFKSKNQNSEQQQNEIDEQAFDQQSMEREDMTMNIEVPWDENGGKKPEDYTWDEFIALESELQIIFQSAFKNADGFDRWLQENEPMVEDGESEIECPWDVKGSKQPEDYTWDEFMDLEAEQQICFQSAFEDADGFEKWLEENEE